MRSLNCFFHALLLAISLVMPAQAHHRFALVFSGGGSRGLAQIGVLKAFAEAGIRPDCIVANSMGAVVGALYAGGYSPDSIARFCTSVSWDDFFQNEAGRQELFVSRKTEPVDYLLEIRFDYDLSPILPNAISYGQAFYNALSPKFAAIQYRSHMNFDSLPIPLRIVTTDLLTGNRVVLSHGDLPTAVRASCSVPLAFTAVALDTMLLVDGGLTANIPIQAAIDDKADYIVAIDVTSPIWRRGDLNNPIRVADQIVNFGITRQKEQQKKLANVLITPDLAGYLSTDFSHLDSLISRGYQAARAAIPRIRAELAADSMPAPAPAPARDDTVSLPIAWEIPRQLRAADLDGLARGLSTDGSVPLSRLRAAIESFCQKRDLPFASIDRIYYTGASAHLLINPGTVSDIIIRGTVKTSSRLVVSALPFKRGEVLRRNSPATAIAAVNSLDLFENVNVAVDSLRRVIVTVKEKKYLRARASARFDEFHLLEGYIEPAYENLLGAGICAQAHLQYGLRREKYALELSGNFPYTRVMAAAARLQTYIAREKIVTRIDDTVRQDTSIVHEYSLRERSLQKPGVLGVIGTEISKTGLLETGFKIENYQVYATENSVLENLDRSFPNGLRSLMARLTIDDIDRFPFPRKGRKDYICMSIADKVLGGTERFAKIEGSAVRHFTFGKRHTLYPQVHFGWSSASLSEAECFYVGGAFAEEKYRDIDVYDYISFMGLPPRALPCDIVAIAALNYRWRMARDLYLTTTLNAGYAWQKSKFSFSRAIADEAVRDAPIGAGIGVAWETIAGPVRFSWGRLVRGSTILENGNDNNIFYFSAGHDF
jgi:predicted acylesterase/phospholipase RssA